MTGARVIAFPRRPEQEPKLTYAQLARELEVSQRFLQMRVAEGMPDAGLDYRGRRRFLQSEVRPWLDARQARLARRRMGDGDSPPVREETS